MNVRWLWFDCIDPHFALTRAQKREIAVRARQMIFRNRAIFTLGETQSPPVRRPGSFVLLLNSMRSVVLMIAAVLALFALSAATQSNFAGASILAAVSAAMYVSWAHVNRVCARPWNRLAMYELGYPICAQCGYALMGTEESKRCPECGWWKTKPDDPPRVAWSEDDRDALREHGYETCAECGGLIRARETDCPRCGERRS